MQTIDYYLIASIYIGMVLLRRKKNYSLVVFLQGN